VVSGTAAAIGLSTWVHVAPPPGPSQKGVRFIPKWAVVAPSEDALPFDPGAGDWRLLPPRDADPAWTDEHADLVGYLD